MRTEVDWNSAAKAFDRLNVNTGDRYISTYTYGPLGMIARTDEFGDDDPTNNRDHYYLSDATGNSVGLQVDDDGDASTARLARFQVYDSFGNHVAESTAGVGLRGSFAWRGQEGSATDAGTKLVYMQNRHYDPELGRFVQADDLLLASLTAQGMNRFVYAENDPINMTDPGGRAAVSSGPAVFALISGFLAIPHALGYLVGMGAWFGLRLGGLASGIWRLFHDALWANKGRICKEVLKEYGLKILRNLAIKIGLRIVGVGFLALADTIALGLAAGFAVLAASAGTNISYYQGYQAGFIATLESEW